MNKKVVILLAIILIVGSISGFFFWRYYTSPQYSLLQIKNALNEHDITKFEQYVDIEGATSNLIDNLSDYQEKPESQKTEDDKIGEVLGKSLLAEMKPNMVKEFQQQIKKYVETSDIGSFYKKDAFNIGNIVNKSGINYLENIESVNTEGKISTVTLNINHKRYKQNLPLKIKMRNKGSYWQVSDISNVPELLNQIDELEVKKIADLNKEVFKEINNTLHAEDCIKYEGDVYNDTYEYVVDKKVYISCNLFNFKDKDITDFEADIKVSNKSGIDLSSLRIDEDKIIEPESIKPFYWSISMEQGNATHQNLFESSSDDLIYFLNVKSITFKDGTILKPYEKYATLPDNI